MWFGIGFFCGALVTAIACWIAIRTAAKRIGPKF